MKAIKKETPEAPSTKVKILIDTNIYLNFYRSKKDSIKLLSELAKHFDKIILTDQIIQEFERNREVVINEMKRLLNLIQISYTKRVLFRKFTRICRISQIIK